MASVLELQFASDAAVAPLRIAMDGAIIGRSADVEVPIPDASASRQHAKLHRRDGEFEIENLSPNGTKVNGKPIEKKRLRDGDVIEIGASTRLRVRYLTQSGAVVGHDDTETQTGGAFDDNAESLPPAAAPRKSSLLKKPKVVIGLTVYFVGLLALMLMLESRSGTVGPPPGLSRRQIADMMDAYFAETSPAFSRSPDAKKEAAALDRAREAFNTAPVSPQSLWRATFGFREALAYSPSRAWRSPEDVRRFQQARGHLIDRLCDAYIDALAEHRKGRLRDARGSFNKLQEIVVDRNCELNRHIGRWLAAINAQME